MDFRNAWNTVAAELTPQPWDCTVGRRTLTVIPAGLPHAEPGTAEVYVRIAVAESNLTAAAEAAVTTTDLPALITALSAPVTEVWEHQPHYPDGTPKGRIGTWLGDDYGLSLAPTDGGFRVTVAEDTSDGIEWVSATLPEAQRLPLASALRRAMDVARGWEDGPQD